MKSKIIAIVLVLAAIAVIIGISVSRDSSPVPQPDPTATTTVSVPASEVTKVSSSLSEYQNAELGFSVEYPSTWDKEELNAGVRFDIPVDKDQVTTIATLQMVVEVAGRTCAFPPVTTVKERSKVTLAGKSFDMLSMSNTVQGKVYTNRMYSLQKGEVCYTFSFASIALAPSSKGLTGSNATQAQNNNKAITSSADSAFTKVVESFEFVTGPQGVDETKVNL